MQIKTPEEVKRENGIIHSPSKQLDFTDPSLTQAAESKRLNREINRLRKTETELRKQIKARFIFGHLGFVTKFSQKAAMNLGIEIYVKNKLQKLKFWSKISI